MSSERSERARRPPTDGGSRWIPGALRVVSSAVVLGVLALSLDVQEIAGRIREVHGGWLLAALLVSVIQMGLSAWRWRFTARRLGLRLPYREALREYYLASFLNQVLPGGVLGDVSRAWRHARGGSSPGSAVRSVLLERASGQLVMLGWAGACAGILLFRTGIPDAVSGLLDSLPILGVVTGSVVVAGVLLRQAPWARIPGVRESWVETRRALLHPAAFPVQAASSLLVVGSYVLVFVLACRAVGIDAPSGTLALLIPPVLLAMLVPISFAGWGLREGAAALVWAAAGLSAADGTAASVVYGLVVLLSTLPGALVLLTIRWEADPGGPDRRERPTPGGRSDRGASTPPPASPPVGG